MTSLSVFEQFAVLLAPFILSIFISFSIRPVN